jgi:hypothetical protein
MEEESGLRVSEIEFRGLIKFELGNDDKYIIGHIYKAYKYEGEIKESEEMRP